MFHAETMFQYFPQKARAGHTSLISKYYLEYGPIVQSMKCSRSYPTSTFGYFRIHCAQLCKCIAIHSVSVYCHLGGLKLHGTTRRREMKAQLDILEQ